VVIGWLALVAWLSAPAAAGVFPTAMVAAAEMSKASDSACCDQPDGGSPCSPGCACACCFCDGVSAALTTRTSPTQVVPLREWRAIAHRDPRLEDVHSRIFRPPAA